MHGGFHPFAVCNRTQARAAPLDHFLDRERDKYRNNIRPYSLETKDLDTKVDLLAVGIPRCFNRALPGVNSLRKSLSSCYQRVRDICLSVSCAELSLFDMLDKLHAISF